MRINKVAGGSGFLPPVFCLLCERFLEIYRVAKFDWQTSCVFVFVGYVHLVVNLYGVVVDTVVRYRYKLWFAFGHGSDNQISFIHVHNYCTFVASVLLLR